MSKLEYIFDREKNKILEEVDHFYKILTRLRYEGKVSRGRNIKSSREALKDLIESLETHCKLEEKIIFPFLLTHMPKRESVIQFLRSDYEDIRKNKERLHLWLKDLLKNENGIEIEGKVQQAGVYLTCLIRHHMELEKENIHKAIQRELKPKEKKEITKRVQKWFASRKGIGRKLERKEK